VHVEDITTEDDGPRWETERGLAKLQVIDDGVVRLVYTGGDSVPDHESPMVRPQDTSEDWTTRETDGEFELITDALRVELDRETGALTWRTRAGDRLVGEPPDGGRSVTPVSPADLSPGEAETATPRESLDREAYSTRLDLEFDEDEAILGLGQHEEGLANYRGESQILYQGNTKVAMPAFVSRKGYGMLWNTGSVTTFHDDGVGTYVWTECDDALDVFFVYGPGMDDVIAGFRQLTGESTMLPKWTYGYVQSRERYATQDELLDVVREYREREVPLDCVVQDWQDAAVHRQVRTFWDFFAPRYADETHVLYEFWNEPQNPADDTLDNSEAWKEVAQQMVDRIRGDAPDTPSVVGSPGWTSLTKYAAETPFEGENLIYAGHIYPGDGESAEALDPDYGAPAEEVPVMITEWGFDGTDTVQPGTKSNFGEPFREWLDGRENVGWTAWCLDSHWHPTMLDFDHNTTGGETYHGWFVKRWLAETRERQVPDSLVLEGSEFRGAQDSTPPETPTGVAVEGAEGRSVTLSWDQSKDFETRVMHYNV
jgi:hypothetical protein